MPNEEARRRRARHSARTVLLASLVNILFTVVAMGIFLAITNETKDTVEEERVNRAVESCLQYNRDQTRSRNFSTEQLAVVFRVFLRNRTEAEIQELVDGPEFDRYEDFVITSFPYRQCSTRCVEAHVNPVIKDCVPARDETGAA